MTIHLATKTLIAIEDAIKKDQGALYRKNLGLVINHVGDAYSPHTFPFRSHLGASGIGNDCARAIWYGFRWATLPEFGGRLLRLFNRGHLEEARFIALLLTIGCEVYQQDENGDQFRISDAGGHVGGSGDGVVVRLPDLEADQPALCEFKTSAEKPFLKLKKEGVRIAKFVHYVQIQIYMGKMGLAVALYMVVNKNNDELYAELVPFDKRVADEFIQRGVNLVWTEKEPDKICNSPGWFECKWCDHRPVCHLGEVPHVNCRTCLYGSPKEDGNWYCRTVDCNFNSGECVEKLRTKEQQLEACERYERKF